MLRENMMFSQGAAYVADHYSVVAYITSFIYPITLRVRNYCYCYSLQVISLQLHTDISTLRRSRRNKKCYFQYTVHYLPPTSSITSEHKFTGKYYTNYSLLFSIVREKGRGKSVSCSYQSYSYYSLMFCMFTGRVVIIHLLRECWKLNVGDEDMMFSVIVNVDD